LAETDETIPEVKELIRNIASTPPSSSEAAAMVTTQSVLKTQQAIRLRVAPSGSDDSKMTGHDEEEPDFVKLLTIDQISRLSDEDPVWDSLPHCIAKMSVYHQQSSEPRISLDCTLIDIHNAKVLQQSPQPKN